MTALTENYLREVEASLRADAERKRQILAELRGHLQEKVEELRRADPERPYEEIERAVLHDFGNPRDLALAYEPDGIAVLKNRAGDTVLRVGQAVGRGAATAARAAGRGIGTVLKVVGITVAVMLVVALALGVWAYYEFKPALVAMAEDSVPVYSFSKACGEAGCDQAAAPQVFYVKPGARQVRFDLDVGPRYWHDPDPSANGTVAIVVTDPHGNVRYDRTLDLASEGGHHHTATWAAVEGNWTIAVGVEDFTGHVDVRAWTWSAPWPDW